MVNHKYQAVAGWILLTLAFGWLGAYMFGNITAAIVITIMIFIFGFVLLVRTFMTSEGGSNG